MMKPLASFNNTEVHTVFTDIDDTITDEGQLHADAYESLWRLKENGIRVVPVTGRPAGWCEMIARFWPVHGIIGENGGFYFRYHDRKMKRHFVFNEATMKSNREKLELIKYEVLRNVRGCAIASDQFSRLMDLAVDFAEDVGPLSDNDINQIVSIFEKHGAVAKVSSIHVNGWFGSYDKLSMTKEYCTRELGFDFTTESASGKIAFCGDSPNDEPMFGAFQSSFAVANITKFADRLKSKPAFVAGLEGGKGFVQIVDRLLQLRKS
ncbi:MAG: HAD-IIB family hydrolase [Bdellovibrionales bacterium]|nr:HAD-IIB family hydrolase [Bdellovibrionales bacterium]